MNNVVVISDDDAHSDCSERIEKLRQERARKFRENFKFCPCGCAHRRKGCICFHGYGHPPGPGIVAPGYLGPDDGDGVASPEEEDVQDAGSSQAVSAPILSGSLNSVIGVSQETQPLVPYPWIPAPVMMGTPDNPHPPGVVITPDLDDLGTLAAPVVVSPPDRALAELIDAMDNRDRAPRKSVDFIAWESEMLERQMAAEAQAVLRHDRLAELAADWRERERLFRIDDENVQRMEHEEIMREHGKRKKKYQQTELMKRRAVFDEERVERARARDEERDREVGPYDIPEGFAPDMRPNRWIPQPGAEDIPPYRSSDEGSE